jgi:hypothetical protein
MFHNSVFEGAVLKPDSSRPEQIKGHILELHITEYYIIERTKLKIASLYRSGAEFNAVKFCDAEIHAQKADGIDYGVLDDAAEQATVNNLQMAQIHIYVLNVGKILLTDLYVFYKLGEHRIHREIKCGCALIVVADFVDCVTSD